MKESPWVTSFQASRHFGVSENTLEKWRQIGYLKPGTHWRRSSLNRFYPWIKHIVYHLRWCQEEMDYWRSHDAQIDDMAA